MGVCSSELHSTHGAEPGASATMPAGSRVRHVSGECWPLGTSKYWTAYPFCSSTEESRRLASSSDGAEPPNAPPVSRAPTSRKNFSASFGDVANWAVSHSYGGLLDASAPRQNAPLCESTLPNSAG